MGLTGDFAKLDKMAKAIGELASGWLVPRLAQVAQPLINDVVQEQLGAGVDPYGTPWEANQDGSQPLEGMRASAKVKKSKKGQLSARIGRRVAWYHQHGNKNLPKRELLPTDEQGLPLNWDKQLHVAADTVEQELAELGGGEVE